MTKLASVITRRLSNDAFGSAVHMDALSDPSGDAGERDHFIPARKIDVIEAILAEGLLGDGTDHGKFRQFCQLLGATEVLPRIGYAKQVLTWSCAPVVVR